MADAKRGEVQIGDKTYLTVARRIDDFRNDDEFEGWSVETELVSADDVKVVMRAVIKDAAGKVASTGFAEEVRDSSRINKTSSLENCETSAVGRALAFLGLAGGEIASADEVVNAIETQNTQLLYTVTNQLLSEVDYDENATCRFAEFVHGLSDEDQRSLYGCGAAGEKMKFKARWDDALRTSNRIFDEAAEKMKSYIRDQDAYGLAQLRDSFSDWQAGRIRQRMARADAAAARELLATIKGDDDE